MNSSPSPPLPTTSHQCYQVPRILQPHSNSHSSQPINQFSSDHDLFITSSSCSDQRQNQPALNELILSKVSSSATTSFCPLHHFETTLPSSTVGSPSVVSPSLLLTSLPSSSSTPLQSRETVTAASIVDPVSIAHCPRHGPMRDRHFASFDQSVGSVPGRRTTVGVFTLSPDDASHSNIMSSTGTSCTYVQPSFSNHDDNSNVITPTQSMSNSSSMRFRSIDQNQLSCSKTCSSAQFVSAPTDRIDSTLTYDRDRRSNDSGDDVDDTEVADDERDDEEEPVQCNSNAGTGRVNNSNPLRTQVTKNVSRPDRVGSKRKRVATDKCMTMSRERTFSSNWKSGGVRNRRLKRLTHPLERSVAGFFVITLFFTLLAIVSGVPFVLLFCLLLPIGLVFRALCNCECVRSQRLDERKCTPIECFWLRAGMRNNCKRARSLCLLYFDDGLSLPQLRELVMSRLIQRPGMERFRWVLRHKGTNMLSITFCFLNH